jgi:hypothetical protein
MAIAHRDYEVPNPSQKHFGGNLAEHGKIRLPGELDTSSSQVEQVAATPAS